MKFSVKKLSALLVAGFMAVTVATPMMAEAHRGGDHNGNCPAYSQNCPGYASCTHDADCPVHNGNCPR